MATCATDLPVDNMGWSWKVRLRARCAGVWGALALALGCLAPAHAQFGGAVVCGPAILNARVLLQGALTLTPLRTALTQAGGHDLMGDELRVGQAGVPFIPLAQPYSGLPAAAKYQFVGTSGSETMQPSVLAVTGSDAIVDWVFLELRDATDGTRIVATRAALLQRDGDIVDTNGVSAVTFDIAAGSYFVAVRHRNHMGVMTATPVDVTGGMAVLDFSSGATPLYANTDFFAVAGTQTILLGDGRRALWGGDANLSCNDTTVPGGVRHKIKFTGSCNDTDAVSATVLFFPANTTFLSDFDQAYGYLTSDTTMDGRARSELSSPQTPVAGDACSTSNGGVLADDTKLICNNLQDDPANPGHNPAYDFAVEHLPSVRVLAPPATPGIVACAVPPTSIPTLDGPMLVVLSLLVLGWMARRSRVGA